MLILECSTQKENVMDAEFWNLGRFTPKENVMGVGACDDFTQF